jgi:hypothetical protein
MQFAFVFVLVSYIYIPVPIFYCFHECQTIFFKYKRTCMEAATIHTIKIYVSIHESLNSVLLKLRLHRANQVATK